MWHHPRKRSPDLDLRALVFAAVSALAFAALGIAGYEWLRGNPTVYFVNGLDRPLTFQVTHKGAPVAAFELPPRTFAEKSLLPVGYTITVRDERGAEVERESVEIPSGDHFLAYNALGAAPLFYQRKALFESELLLLSGPRFIVERPVEAPLTGDGDARTSVFMKDGGWRTTLAELAEREDVNLRARLMRRVLLLQPDIDDAPEAFTYVMHQLGVQAAVQLYQKLQAKAPEGRVPEKLAQAAQLLRVAQRP